MLRVKILQQILLLMFHNVWIIECWGIGFSFRTKNGIHFFQSIQIQNQILIFSHSSSISCLTLISLLRNIYWVSTLYTEETDKEKASLSRSSPTGGWKKQVNRLLYIVKYSENSCAQGFGWLEMRGHRRNGLGRLYRRAKPHLPHEAWLKSSQLKKWEVL